jgi:hypothetical protein
MIASRPVEEKPEEVETFYTKLNLNRNATLEEIGNACTKLGSSKKVIDAQFLNEIYTTLSDRSKRRVYDLFLDIFKVIQNYLANPNRDIHLSFFSKKLDSQRGLVRARNYYDLLDPLASQLQKAVAVQALLQGGGTNLKAMVLECLNYTDEQTKVKKTHNIPDIISDILLDDGNRYAAISKVIESIQKKSDKYDEDLENDKNEINLILNGGLLKSQFRPA